MLYSLGVGTLSYVIAARFDEVAAIALHQPSPLAAWSVRGAVPSTEWLHRLARRR